MSIPELNQSYDEWIELGWANKRLNITFKRKIKKNI